MEQNLEKIDKEIESISRVLSRTPDDNPNLRLLLGCLGKAHNKRYDLLEEPDDIQKMIKYTTIVLTLTPDDDPGLPGLLSTLGGAHGKRFQRLGEIDDNEKDIEYTSLALALTPDGHPDLPRRLANLALFYKDRFERLGELGDIEKAIEYDTRAVAVTPHDHPDLSERLGKLGISHGYLYQCLGELNHLEQAIEYQSRGLASTNDAHPRLPTMLVNLAISHHNRFQHLDELDDLQKAIQYESRALALTHDGHPRLSAMLANIGLSHSYLFKRHGELDDLEKAIEYEYRALALTPDDHPHLSQQLANLGTSFRNRFRCLGEMDDLEKSNEYTSRALTLTPDGHPHLPWWLNNLGASHIDRFKQLACKSPVGAPRARFKNALKWALQAAKYSGLNCIEAYQATMDLLPQFIWLGATTDQRYEDLRLVEALAVDAATAAILSSSYSLALEWLEHARCVVWNQNLLLRSPLDQLQTSHPVLATRLQSVADQLHNFGSESRESRAVSSSTLTSEQIAQGHRRLAKEYNELLTHTRTLPGFEDFLQPMKANQLVHTAQNGPIVIINCHKDRCDALLILPQQDNVSHLPLPNFDGEKARRARSEMEISIESQRLREREVERRPLVEEIQNHEFESVLAVLWNNIVKPILDFLGFTDHAPVGNLPHITWCPTGAMTFLPLHAAGNYDEPQSRVFNYVVSSYTPTLTAILESNLSSLTCDSQVLAIGQKATPGHSRLPGTAMELEFVKAHTHEKAKYSELIDDQATTTAVLDAMKRHDWVHFACHAHQNVRNAMESGFFLHDGVLDLASINRQSFKRKGLAFLSACQTATGDETLPDEAVHLASGMLMAGFSSVIATMWSVVDADAPFVADKVYGQLMVDGKLGSGEAGKALHNAVSGLREKVGEKEFARWMDLLQYTWGIPSFGLNLDSSRSLIFLRTDYHRAFDIHDWVMVPSMHNLIAAMIAARSCRHYLEEVVPEWLPTGRKPTEAL
ncbi:hypothetical protein RSAG8_13221, partial [Rhizoctonia solani AG-8 WAC10335]